MEKINIVKLSIFIAAMLILFIIYFISRKNKKYIKFLGYVGTIYSIIYILWRFLYTLPPVASFGFVFGLILIIFEIIAFLQAVVSKTLFSSSRVIKLKKDAKFTDLPTVDIFISTYNEPEEVLRRTIIGCKDIDYPKDKFNIFIGDDGKRENIKLLSEELGITYVIREGNAHAKAGNINNMMSISNGEFVLLLDADMIPSRDIINKMIYYFEDSKTGFVQAPQVFYNLDPFQYNLELGDTIPNEQDFFMRTIEEKRALYNAVLHVGTNAIFRRSALNEIGGIPTGSITEDMATGMLLQNAGYKSYFVKDPLALGLSVESFEDLIGQRDRWCRGNVQVIKKYNPLKMKGLSFFQKVIYIDGFFYWIFGVQKLVYIIAPLLYLLFGVIIIEANPLDIAMMFLPYFLSTSMFFRVVSNRNRNVTWSHIYDTAIAPQLAVSFIFETFFNKQLKFKVTPKGITSDKNVFKFRLAAVHIFIFIISVIAVVTNVYLVISGYDARDFNSVLINIIWCIYNALAVFVSIFLFLEKKRFRKYERIPANLRVSTLITSCSKCAECNQCGNVVDISEQGALVVVKENCPHFKFSKGENIELNIESIGDLNAEITRVEKKEDEYEMGLRFNDIGLEEFANINKYRFNVSNKYINNSQIDTASENFSLIILKLFRKFIKR